MTALVWDRKEDKRFEIGVDQGVLYMEDGHGVAWNGITEVEEKAANTVEAVYFDGVKINDLVVVGDWTGVLRAITYPDEFVQFEGVGEDQQGVLVHNQPQRRFHLCYRTKIGDADGNTDHYKIHLLWNLTALPSSKSYETMNDELDPMEFEWTITAIPEEIENFRPTAHIVIDTRKMDPWLIEDIESIIYGDEDSDAKLPSLKGLTTFIRKWDRLIIRDNGDGTWTAITPRDDGTIEMVSPTEFKITTDNALYLDADTYKIWSSDKNEEDIF